MYIWDQLARMYPLRYYLSCGLTQKQIGERLGLTQQAVSYHVKRLRTQWLEEDEVIAELHGGE